MRMLSMILIVIHHIVGQGLGFQFYCVCGGGKTAPIMNWIPVIYIEAFCIVGVNLFLLISGYYKIKLRCCGVLKFLGVVFAFVLLHSFGEMLYNHSISIKSVLHNIVYFYSGNSAWFVKSYFLLMLASFLINPALERLSKRQLLTLLLIVIYVNVYLGFIRYWSINENGYTLSQMIMVYVIGYSLKIFRVPDKCSSKLLLMGYVGASLLLAFIMHLCFGKVNGEIEFRMLGYNNPLIIISSICLFCFFLKYNFCNEKMNYLLSGVFGIYLFHQYHPFWTKVMIPIIRAKYEQLSLCSFFMYAFGLLIMVIVVGSFVNLVANKVIGMILNVPKVNSICKRIDSKFGLYE